MGVESMDVAGWCRILADEAEERVEGVTEGPWSAYREVRGEVEEVVGYGVSHVPPDPFGCSSLTCGHLSENDARFIAWARIAVPEFESALRVAAERIETLDAKEERLSSLLAQAMRLLDRAAHPVEGDERLYERLAHNVAALGSRPTEDEETCATCGGEGDIITVSATIPCPDCATEDEEEK